MLTYFGIKDLIDILLVAYILYQIYKMMKSSGSINIFVGASIFVFVWVVVSQVLDMKLLGYIFDKFVSVAIIAFIILFQDDIRRFFILLGSQQRKNKFFRFLTHTEIKVNNRLEDLLPIINACLLMGKKKTGALIVLEHEIRLNNIVKTGELLDAKISQQMIENIFFKNSPLHDGAMIISKNRVKAAGCILPVSKSEDIPKELGLRHRAALGVSQQSDAKAIIVSEETGRISVAYKGRFYLNLTVDGLKNILLEE